MRAYSNSLWPALRRVGCAALLVALAAGACVTAAGQQAASSETAPTRDAAPASTGNSVEQDSVGNADPTASAESLSTTWPRTPLNATSPRTVLQPPPGAPEPLSAEDIFAVLQAQPDTVVELKNMVAGMARKQGLSLQPDTITDEALYEDIASSPDLRSNITTYLRARGYAANPVSNPVSTDETEAYDQDLDLRPESSVAPYSNQPAGSADEMLRAAPAPALHGETSRTRTTSPRVNPPPRIPAAPEVLHRPAPYNLLALRDLYTQTPEGNEQLKRFGSDVFLHHEGGNQLGPNHLPVPLDVPAEDNYVLGPGDALAIDMWGGVSQNLTRTVDRDGKLALPDAGAVQVAGMSLEHARSVIATALERQYRDVKVSVTVARLRTIRIYVVGDVQRPGAYDISSLSTPLNALYAAGGPTSTGSLRVLRHYRGRQLIREVDLYDFLLRGVVTEDRLQSGDTVLAPPAGPQVTVYGAVKRPAIYELREEATLAAVLEDAGGATVGAELQHIVIDRIDANLQRETVTVPLSGGSDSQAVNISIAAFAIHDGDRVHVAPILPYSQRVVYTDGHVARPGRMPYHDNMQLNEVLRSYRDLLPEPAERGEIVRLVPPDLHVEAIPFSVPDILLGNTNVLLQPFDTVRVFGRYEADAPRVTISGEVLRPGIYALSDGMTAAQLVRLSGGFKRDALLTEADLASYKVVAGTRVVSERASVRIGEAVADHDRTADVMLKPGDVLTVHQLTGWSDIGASITIEGEVAHPGRYGFQQGERLSSVLRRAGGLRDTSYPEGAVLLREEVRKLENKSREELIRQIETSSAAARIRPTVGTGDQAATLQLIEQQQTEVLSRLRNQPASGRLVIHISADISSWENTPADIEVRAGDILRIPKRPGFVLVSGQVYNASAITFTPGKTAAWYLRAAGGATEVANTRQIFVIRANGSVVGRESRSWLSHDVLSTKLDPGDVVVVPQKIIGTSVLWRNLLTVAQITSSIAITAAVAGVL